MYVTDDMLAEMAERYGQPRDWTVGLPATPAEMARIRSTQKHGRNHDVTLYITRGEKLIVIAKHIYPRGLYRSMSGGLKPHEDFETGIRRELAEEIGCEVEIDRFLLHTHAGFVHGDDLIYWRSFVFLAHYTGGDYNFTDKREIREVAEVDWSDFEKFGRMMRQTQMAGLHYRAALHEEVAKLLGK
jgi:8-oxo-dGTP pyrophosphatase MutT (NUDIX family)